MRRYKMQFFIQSKKPRAMTWFWEWAMSSGRSAAKRMYSYYESEYHN